MFTDSASLDLRIQFPQPSTFWSWCQSPPSACIFVEFYVALHIPPLKRLPQKKGGTQSGVFEPSHRGRKKMEGRERQAMKREVLARWTAGRFSSTFFLDTQLQKVQTLQKFRVQLQNLRCHR